MITTLIDKQDGFEVVRDKIAQILKVEVNSQMALATTAGKDPTLWDLRIFSERANPWEVWTNNTDDRRPLINVWFDSANFDKSRGNTVERQQAEGTFNIDCYAFAVSEDVPAGGHKVGDKEAALTAHRALRLVRNILMAGTYTYLDLRGLVGQRWPSSIQVFQPELDSNTVQQVIGARIALSVRYNELSPQVEGQILEEIHIEVRRVEDGEETGEIYFEAEFDHTL